MCRSPYTYGGMTEMDSDTRRERGLVILLPGIEGRSMYNRWICRGLLDGGVPYAIQLHDWTLIGRFSLLYNLRALKRNRRKAVQIAEHICRYKRDHPNGPVFLVGQSGGGAMSALIAESLPDDCELEGIVMIANALSPKYDLTDALRKTRRGIVSTVSRRDALFLGLGTTMFGTVDGVHQSAAGRVGFERRDNPEYEKLFELQYQPHFKALKNNGGHITSGAKEFVAVHIAPLICAENWSKRRVEELSAVPVQSKR